MIDVLVLLVIAGLATARITTLVVHDAILEPLRNRVFLLSPPPNDFDRGFLWQDIARPSLRRWLTLAKPMPTTGDDRRRVGLVGKLLSCDRCVAVWVVIGGAAAYTEWPDAVRLVVLVAAVAQLAGIAAKAAD